MTRVRSNPSLKRSANERRGNSKTQSQPQALSVVATVTEVLPLTGLAYLTDSDGRAWPVTKSTAGRGLQALEPGVRVALSVVQHDSFSYATEYVVLG